MKTLKNRAMSFAVCMVLIVAMALSMTACGSGNNNDSQADGQNQSQTVQVSFQVEVTDADGNTITIDVTTDKSTVGEALLEQGIIAGDEGPYGLYVKEVNGIVADYDTDGSWWGFYINGEMASTGVDGAEVEEGAVYGFKVEK